MSRINKLILYFFFILTACGQAPVKKLNKQEILKEGAELYAKYGCAVCHSLEGKVIYGPPLNGLFMKEVNVLRKGKQFTVIADRDYLKKSISDPRYEKVLEYKNKEMPMSNFSKDEAEILVEYIIALDEEKEIKND